MVAGRFGARTVTVGLVAAGAMLAACTPEQSSPTESTIDWSTTTGVPTTVTPTTAVPTTTTPPVQRCVETDLSTYSPNRLVLTPDGSTLAFVGWVGGEPRLRRHDTATNTTSIVAWAWSGDDGATMWPAADGDHILWNRPYSQDGSLWAITDRAGTHRWLSFPTIVDSHVIEVSDDLSTMLIGTVVNQDPVYELVDLVTGSRTTVPWTDSSRPLTSADPTLSTAVAVPSWNSDGEALLVDLATGDAISSIGVSWASQWTRSAEFLGADTIYLENAKPHGSSMPPSTALAFHPSSGQFSTVAAPQATDRPVAMSEAGDTAFFRSADGRRLSRVAPGATRDITIGAQWWGIAVARDGSAAAINTDAGTEARLLCFG